ncbi:hypothetical protein PR003_g32805 [Phytophthora rubi]|uniref:Uncharacterized protein n=1 Tax=Phytophthora rubi TaxID=129364 RepID=A0A6A4B2J1_9STRA|nr:hypothetical protein PR003_g32805 [Phytophthora rubi]
MKSYIETTCPTTTPSSSTRSCSRGWGRSGARTRPSIARVGQVAERDPPHQRLGHDELDQDLVVNEAAHRQRRIAHTPHAAEIKRKQMPWSVTLMTLAFVSAVVKDDAYLQQTSDVTPPRWRASAVQQLSKHFPTRAFFGKPFLS